MEKRKFGGSQPGAGRPAKNGVRKNLLLANDVGALLPKLKAHLSAASETEVVERAVRELAQRESISRDEN